MEQSGLAAARRTDDEGIALRWKRERVELQHGPAVAVLKEKMLDPDHGQ
jgi:hypothetical protein